MTSRRRHGRQGVEDGLGPGRHLLVLAARQVAELLAADRVQRPEDHHLAVLPALQHGLQARAQGQRRLAGARPAAERDDADVRVHQQVERDALLGASGRAARRPPGRRGPAVPTCRA